MVMSVTASPVVFLFLLAFGVERDVLQKVLEAVAWVQLPAPSRVAIEFLEVADPVLGVFRILFQTAEFGEIADFFQKLVRPGLE